MIGKLLEAALRDNNYLCPQKAQQPRLVVVVRSAVVGEVREKSFDPIIPPRLACSES
jgi:hypothetical protein